ncbi:MAG TPA: hypothetical protein VJN18_32560 [Polyangiaceae bacterium]|nr:hypothetical protein [Polyangiaceae bacterium]
MHGYAAREIFTEAEQALASRVSNLVALSPYDIDGEPVRCHELVRAVGEELGLSWADGWFGMVEHSWLWTRAWLPLEPIPNILDPYVPGRLPQTQLIHTGSHVLPLDYRRGDYRKDIRWPVITHLRNLMRSAA